MPLLSLPNESLYQIIAFLDFQSEINSVSQTCKHLHALANRHLYSLLPGAVIPATLLGLADRGNIDALRQLLRHNVDLYQLFEDSNEPFTLGPNVDLAVEAAARGHLDIVRLLVNEYPYIVNDGSPDNISRVLNCALFRGRMDIAQFLLDRTTENSSLGPARFCHALTYYASRGNLTVVEFLVSKTGVDINCDGGAPFKRAFDSGHWDVVEYLLQHGVKPLGVDDHANTWRILNTSAQPTSDHKLVQRMLEEGGHPRIESILRGGWDLVRRCPNKDLVFLRFKDIDRTALLATTPDNEFTDIYSTLLGAATDVGDTSMLLEMLDFEYVPGDNKSAVRKLLGNSSPPWEPHCSLPPDKHNGCAPLGYAVDNGRIDCIELLLESYSQILPPKSLFALRSWVLWRAVEQGSSPKLSVIKHFLVKYSHSCFGFEWVERLLSHDERSIRFIMKYHLDQYLTATSVKGCLIDYFQRGNVAAMEMLRVIMEKKMVDLRSCFSTHWDSVFYDGSTLTFRPNVAKSCQPEAFKLLLKYLNITMCPNSTTLDAVLFGAAEQNNVDIVRLFLDNGFDASREYGMPLLITTVENCDFQLPGNATLRLLLERGASVDAEDEDTQLTALAHAVLRENTGVARILLDAGANPILNLYQSDTPLEIAARECQNVMLRILLKDMEARQLKVDDILALAPAQIPRYAEWALDTDKALRHHYWRSMYPVPE